MSDILDIKRIVYQPEGLDNLKMILLNNQQYALLNYISKNNLNNINEGNDSNKSLFIIDKNFIQNEENLRTLVNKVFTTTIKESGNSNIDAIYWQ